MPYSITGIKKAVLAKKVAYQRSDIKIFEETRQVEYENKKRSVRLKEMGKNQQRHDKGPEKHIWHFT